MEREQRPRFAGISAEQYLLRGWMERLRACRIQPAKVKQKRTGAK